MQTYKAEKFVWVLQDPFGTPIILENAGVRVFPVPTKQNGFIDPRLLHIFNHCHPRGPTLKAFTFVRLY